MPEQHYLVPEHISGAQKDLEYRFPVMDIEEAEDCFVMAKERLWDVNNWSSNCVGMGIGFSLADGHGHELNRRAHKGDVIRARFLGGDATEGMGDEWAMIGAIEYDDYPDANVETFALHICSLANRGAVGDAPGHTATIVLVRDHKELMSACHARNEIADAALALADEQWTSLLKGIIGM